MNNDALFEDGTNNMNMNMGGMNMNMNMDGMNMNMGMGGMMVVEFDKIIYSIGSWRSNTLSKLKKHWLTN